MNDFLTVEDLRKELDNVCKNGYGDMKIRCEDGLLRDNDIGYNIATKEMTIRGHICNVPSVKKINDFCNGVNELYKTFIIALMNNSEE